MTDRPTVDTAGMCSQCHEFRCDCAGVFDLMAEIADLRAQLAAATTLSADRATGEARQSEEDDADTVRAVTAVVREADEAFQKSGGTSRHWVRDWFLPLLNKAGWRVSQGSEGPPIFRETQLQLILAAAETRSVYAQDRVEYCNGSNGIKALAPQWQYEADQWSAIATAIRAARA